MKAPITYYGGKSGMASWIASLLPPHRTYMEPFFGSGAVLFCKRPAVHEIVNDLDGNVVNFFRMLRDRPAELEEVCRLTPYAREEYEAAMLDDDLDDLERARRWWVRVNQGFAKTAGPITGWSVTTARTQSTAASVLGRLGRFAACAERLSGVSIECCDAADLIERLATEDTAIYADPPYVGETRVTSRRSGAWKDYRVDMGDEAAHRRLAEVLRATPAAVILSGYPSGLYEELYGGWWSVDLGVTAHSSNGARVGTRSVRTERLWSNRPLNLSRQGGLFEDESSGGVSIGARQADEG